MPEISVIVPVYKVEKYLEQCISSILAQTFTDYELILIDDGSPDKSGEICDKWAKKDNRIITIHKQNGGLSSARNAGLDICKGRYINFVDSDDYLPKFSLQYLYDLQKKYDADFAMAALVRTDGSTHLQQDNYDELLLSQQQFLSKFYKIGTQENVQYAVAKLYKRELFETIRYPVGLTCEDVPTTYQIVLHSTKIAYSTKIIYFYRYNENSITGTGFTDEKFDLIKVWDIVCKYAYQTEDDHIIAEAEINRKRADFGILMDLAISNISWSEKRKYFEKVKTNISDLKNNMSVLCQANIPLSRKVFIVFFSVNYWLSVFCLHFMSKLFRLIRT